jgi:hypothetical protein
VDADGAVGVHGACLPKDCLAAISWINTAPTESLPPELAYLRSVLQLGIQ